MLQYNEYCYTHRIKIKYISRKDESNQISCIYLGERQYTLWLKHNLILREDKREKKTFSGHTPFLVPHLQYAATASLDLKAATNQSMKFERDPYNITSLYQVFQEIHHDSLNLGDLEL